MKVFDNIAYGCRGSGMLTYCMHATVYSLMILMLCDGVALSAKFRIVLQIIHLIIEFRVIVIDLVGVGVAAFISIKE